MRFLLPALLAAAALLPARADFLAESRNRSADGEHAAAAKLLAKHLQTAPASAALYFELGQSLEKSGNEPEAALAFRRAAILDPGFAPAGNALQESNAQLGAPQQKPGWRGLVAARLPVDPAALAAAVLFWLGAFLFLSSLAFEKTNARLRNLGLLSAATGLILAVAAFVADPRIPASREVAILTPNGSTLYKIPSEDPAEKIATLNAGTVLRILSARGRWFHGELPGGQRGWFPQEGSMPVIPPG
jgi:tetratricopeptide (TPR) repeat protein